MKNKKDKKSGIIAVPLKDDYKITVPKKERVIKGIYVIWFFEGAHPLMPKMSQVVVADTVEDATNKFYSKKVNYKYIIQKVEKLKVEVD